MSDYNLLSIVDAFDKYKKPIFIFTAIAAIGSVLISLSLPDYFKSTTTFYVASQDLSKPEKVLSDEDIEYYGNDEEIDRIMALANSTQLVDQIINSFNLYDHYEITKDAKLAQYKVRKAFKRNYEVIKSKFGGLELSFEDKDPDFAAQIANAAFDNVNQISQQIVYNGQNQLIQIHEATIKDKDQQIQTLNDTLNVLRKHFGIYDIMAQNVAFSEAMTSVKSNLANASASYNSLKRDPSIPVDSLIYRKAKVDGLNSEYKSLKVDLEQFNNGRDRIANLESQLLKTREAISLDRIRLNQINSGKKIKPKTTHLIEAAEPPLRKSKPKRSILVLGATFITFLLTSLGSILFEQYKLITDKSA